MKNKVILSILVIVFIVLVIIFNFKRVSYEEVFYLNNLVGMKLEEAREYANGVGIEIVVEYVYDYETPEGYVISQDISKGEKILNEMKVNIKVSKGSIPSDMYRNDNINELGSVPIMMYHGIVDIPSNETKYIGGNVDKDGYNRTAEAFRNDLEFYYQNNYRMIRLDDYIDGNIDVEWGKSPIILTFDDGNINNFRVLGEENGELIIDKNCAVGILEEFKSKYPDYGVTATFFVNSSLFEQTEYNEKILKWLVSHGYDIGNHTMSHVDFTKISLDKVTREVGGIYNILNNIIGDSYVKIIALPFGSPYNKSHNTYYLILNGNYDGIDYSTKGALRVGWEAEKSCFNKDFDATYLKRIRAYDNNGKDFDIEMNFKSLENKKYISDGDINSVVIKSTDRELANVRDKRLVIY